MTLAYKTKKPKADDAFDEATGAANLAPLRAGEAIMFARKEEFHVERLKPPMNTRKMVEARGRGPFVRGGVRDDCAHVNAIAAIRHRRDSRHRQKHRTGRTSGR